MDLKTKDFKDTLLMPKTDFPMRGNLGVNELPIQAKWEELNIYEKAVKKNEGKEPFYLHDGPPYANGNIHLGHALNKILKDFIVRYKTMSGFYAPYQPGWDTHGLPIEQALTKNKKVNRKEMSIADFRTLCEKYALEQIAQQKIGFKRLGILGDWKDPYITLTHSFEAEQIRCFGKMAARGLIFKGLKPVYWSPSSETALAEAEIEYKDVSATSIYVAFPVVDGKDVLSNDCELVIWTTTPWTIPANLAVCAGAEFEYVVVKVEERFFVVAFDLLESAAKAIGWENYEIVQKLTGDQLEGVKYLHKLYDRVSPVILGDHVTLESGTGLVHTAPGHGEDDFNVGKKYGLEVLCPVDSRGFMTEEAGEFAGMFYEVANDEVIRRLDEECMLLNKYTFMHSYPHDWRTGKPIIFRATPQWFASIDKFKDDILEAIKTVTWYPQWGEVRLANMIKDREDWCISRQRVWGVPIPVFYAEDGTAILDQDVINHVADLYEQHGSNVWFEKDAKDLLPEGYTHPGSPNGKFTKEMDIMDVWFDSGTSHHGALLKKYGTCVADVYLEGSDQYRGWFNSSLITSVALEGKAPYKTIISHGFTLDGQGRKMSKSLGNTVDPIQVCKESGADILRLWVSSVAYQSDMPMSKELLKQISESYRKIRNTLRFLLANVFDFDPAVNKVDYVNLGEVDKYILCRLNEVVKEVHSAYSVYEFDNVYRTILNFLTNELSAFYLDFTKDILYIHDANSLDRRSIQTVFFECLKAITTMLTPILPHTMEEVYSYMPGEKLESIYLCDMVKPVYYDGSEAIIAKFNKFMTLRDDVLKALEAARNEKIIGKSLNAHLVICPNDEMAKELVDFHLNLGQVFIVSKCEVVSSLEDGVEYPTAKIKVTACEGVTCARCWQIVDNVDVDCLCERCQKIVNK
ncbi:MAG: isoleucine--tRNA ligase [Erysipelotrichaceae bacterium]|nr:isoleucine--tRNA ligase [Erysipelotrichaceae bacterium]